MFDFDVTGRVTIKDGAFRIKTNHATTVDRKYISYHSILYNQNTKTNVYLP